MPKLIDYPRASFSRAIELADAVDYLGGNCSWETCADRLGKRVSGAFQAVVGAGTKHSLVSSKSNKLSVTDVYKSIKLAYTNDEKLGILQKAFLAPPVYSKLYEQFKGREMPMQLLNKILMREYEVDDELASRVSKYFLEGAKFTEILIGNKMVDLETVGISHLIIETPEDVRQERGMTRLGKETDQYSTFEIADKNAESFGIHVYGPGMDTRMTISEEEDFLILEAVVMKIRKRLREH